MAPLLACVCNKAFIRHRALLLATIKAASALHRDHKKVISRAAPFEVGQRPLSLVQQGILWGKLFVRGELMYFQATAMGLPQNRKHQKHQDMVQNSVFG